MLVLTIVNQDECYQRYGRCERFKETKDETSSYIEYLESRELDMIRIAGDYTKYLKDKGYFKVVSIPIYDFSRRQYNLTSIIVYHNLAKVAEITIVEN